MDIALYVTNIAVNTVVIVVDIAVIFLAIKTKEIAQHLILWTIFLCMGTDIAVYLNTIFHDVPSFFMDADLFKTPEQAYISMLFLHLQWFSQLFTLLVLSALHFIAAFFPVKFRAILPQHMRMINLLIVFIGILLTVPTYTPYCGFSYIVEGHYWFFDLNKPYSHLYWSCNIILQAICAIVVVCADIAIIWKIRMLRIAVTKKHTSSFLSTIDTVMETVSYVISVYLRQTEEIMT
ncbi:unnamed protein product [Haemonchus placei]|uniref:7TM_GPCR_Srx domain-containing protein n=1 Tax=Haemonchus placei TaxID=6290 RepID=A0A0N4W4R5_HAEPC|nr:unnamed protein product [Haemonchus placei]